MAYTLTILLASDTIKCMIQSSTQSTNQSATTKKEENSATDQTTDEVVISLGGSTGDATIVQKHGDKIYGKMEMTLVSLDYSKRVYHPCELKAVAQMTGSKTVLTRQQIVTIFKNKEVKLEYTTNSNVGGGGKSIMENCYIHEIRVRFGGKMQDMDTISAYVELLIFSKDKKLTLDKYSMAYTGKKLVADILRGPLRTKKIEENDKKKKETSQTKEQQEEKIPNPLSGSKYNVALANASESEDDDLRFLSYTTSDKKRHEFIHPYLVQYNESFYEFIARTANRCGEFLYFEGGKLHVGLPKSSTNSPVKIERYASLTFDDSYEGELGVKPKYHNGMGDGKKNKPYSYVGTAEMAYDVTTPQDDYFITYTEDQWDSFMDEYIGDWGQKIFDTINTILSNTSIKEMIVGFVKDEASAVIEAVTKAQKTNKEKNGTYIDAMPADQKGTAEGDGKGNAPKTASPYSSITGVSEGFRANLLSLFYSTIYKAELYAEKNKIYIDFDNEYMDLTIGRAITVDGSDYLVTEIKGSIGSSNGTYSEKQTVVAVPVFDNVKGKGKDSTSQEANLLPCPPLYEGGHVRQSSPQIAFVEETGDPESHGRVRIKYPWQADCDAPSPWIRMSTPFAIEGGGMYFEPATGTEVLVDYVGGNIEHPYIVGQLYSGNFAAPDGERVISSAEGQQIIMKDAGNSAGFISGLWGANEYLTKLFSGWKKCEANFKDVAGSMTFKDRYGLYSVKLSSADRLISIKSSFGDVKIGAFTGISISAPNGDVKITGKNVTIKAGNTLSITSGSKIPEIITDIEKKKPFRVRAGEAIKGGFKSLFDASTTVGAAMGFLGEKIDLSLLRVITEAIVKPTAGTLKLKSFRYLTLEAGTGEVNIPRRGYQRKGIAQSVDDNYGGTIEMRDNVKLIDQYVEKWDDECRAKYGEVLTHRDALKSLLLTYTTPEKDGTKKWADDKLSELVDGIINKAINSPKKKFVFDDNSIAVSYRREGTTLKIGFAKKDTAEKEKKDKKKFKETFEALCKSVQVFVNTVKEPKDTADKFKFLSGTNTLRSLAQDAGIAIKFYTDMSSGKTNFGATCPTKDDVRNELKKFKRRMAVEYLKLELKVTLDGNIADYELNDDNKWNGYVDKIVEKKRKLASAMEYVDKFLQDAVAGVKDGIVDAVALPDFVHSYNVWGDGKHGEILFSDKSGHTLNFENGHLYQTRNENDFYFDQFTDALKQL